MLSFSTTTDSIVSLLVSLLYIFFFCVPFFDVGLYDPHIVTRDDERPNRWPERVCPFPSSRALVEEAAMGTHVKTIGTQVYRIYRRKRRRTRSKESLSCVIGPLLVDRPIVVELSTRTIVAAKLFCSSRCVELLLMDGSVVNTKAESFVIPKCPRSFLLRKRY